MLNFLECIVELYIELLFSVCINLQKTQKCLIMNLSHFIILSLCLVCSTFRVNLFKIILFSKYSKIMPKNMEFPEYEIFLDLILDSKRCIIMKYIFQILKISARIQKTLKWSFTFFVNYQSNFTYFGTLTYAETGWVSRYVEKQESLNSKVEVMYNLVAWIDKLINE